MELPTSSLQTLIESNFNTLHGFREEQHLGVTVAEGPKSVYTIDIIRKIRYSVRVCLFQQKLFSEQEA